MGGGERRGDAFCEAYEMGWGAPVGEAVKGGGALVGER